MPLFDPFRYDMYLFACMLLKYILFGHLRVNQDTLADVTI